MFKNLPTGTKLILLCGAFLVAIAVAIYGIVAEKRIAIEFARKELIGTRYLDTVRSVYGAILDDRTVGQRKISTIETLQALRSAEAQAGGQLHTAELEQSLAAALRDLWPAEADSGLHSSLVVDALARTQKLVQRIGDDANLALDPDLDTYYLQDTVVATLPMILGHLGEMRALTRGAIASQSPLSRQKVRLLVLDVLVRSEMDGIRANLMAAYRGNPGLKQVLDGDIAAMTASVESYLGVLSEIVARAGTTGAYSAGLNPAQSGAVESTINAWKVTQGELDRLLRLRIDGLLGKLYRSLLITGALACISMVIALMTHRHIVRPLERLEGVARTVRQTGDYTLRSDYTSHDEIGRLAGAFNDMMSELAAAREREAADQARSAAMHQELARASRLTTMGEMAASIAHEINQPLAAIVANGNAGMRWLAHATPDLGEARATLKRIVSDGHRASQVIKSVRAMFRNEGRENVATAVNEVIEEVLALLHGELQNQQVEVRTELDSGLPEIAVDRVQLQQVLLNLMTNAAEAMASITDRPRMLLVKSGLHERDSVLVTVADTGPGIDPQHLGRIFEAFFTTKSTGMGMGLSICRSIVEAHGGRLSASAGTPHGSVFSIVLPGGAARQ